MPDDGDKSLYVIENRLFKEIERPLLEAFYRHRNGPISRDEDHRNVWMVFLYLGEELHAAQVRHLLIGHDHIDGIHMERLQCVSSVSGRKDIKTLIGENLTYSKKRIGFVIDY